MAIVLTIGTNSWATVAQADTYFDTKYGASDWSTLSDDDKKRLLISAFNWINQQTMFDIGPTDTSEIVRQAQFEASWFVYKYFEDFEAHRALIASGVKSYRVLDNSETLENVQFPSFLQAILLDYNSLIRESFPRVHRDLSDNAVK